MDIEGIGHLTRLERLSHSVIPDEVSSIAARRGQISERCCQGDASYSSPKVTLQMKHLSVHKRQLRMDAVLHKSKS